MDIMRIAQLRTFESIKAIYIVQADDHSAGDEHEIEYDIVAGR